MPQAAPPVQDRSGSPGRDNWLTAGLGILGLLIVVVAGVSFRNTRQLRSDTTLVAHTNEVLEALDGLLSTMKDAETGERGFLLTGDERYLEPYHEALGVVEERLATVARLTWGKGMVLVALTGWGQDGDRRKSKDAGFDEHMVKPVDYDALENLLASLPMEPPDSLRRDGKRLP